VSLDPPKVMLERSFLDAVHDTDHPRHDESVTCYRSLVDAYEREEILLVAVGTDLRDLERGADLAAAGRVRWFLHRNHRGLFAPVDPLHIGFQHRRAARRTEVDERGVALTLVMCERYRIRRVATLNEVFEQYELELDPVTER
jgi:hypothetical protein